MRSLRSLLVILSFSTSVLAADSPFSGTWKFNPSKGRPTPPIPKSVVAHVDADTESFKFSRRVSMTRINHYKSTYAAKFDGKEYPIVDDPYSDSVSLQRVSEHEIKFTIKKAGTVVSVLDVVVSKDGQTTTVNYTKYVQGKQEKGAAVYDKQ